MNYKKASLESLKNGNRGEAQIYAILHLADEVRLASMNPTLQRTVRMFRDVEIQDTEEEGA